MRNRHLGATSHIVDRDLLMLLTSILSTEARIAAYFRCLRTETPAPEGFDTPLNMVNRHRPFPPFHLMLPIFSEDC